VNANEAAELLAHCSGFDNRQPSVAAAKSWAAALHDIPLDRDTRNAVAAYYTTPPQDPNARLWILPHHVRTLRSKLRSARLENFQYEPIGDETVGEFMARYRGQLEAIATGRVPGPATAPALTGGPHRNVVKELAGVGRTVPETDDEDLVDTVRRAGPLGVQCPTCHAAIGRPCKIPGGTRKSALGKTRGRPHSARVRTAQGQPDLTAEQRAAAEDRIREASARHIAEQDATP
jgi:hypothetical protein